MDQEEDNIALVIIFLILLFLRRRRASQRPRYRTRPLGRRISGRDYGQGIRLLYRLVGGLGDSMDTLRIKVWTRLELDEFTILWERCEKLGLKTSGVCPAGVKRLMFLYVVTTDSSYSMVGEHFQYSLRTITRRFHEVLRIIVWPLLSRDGETSDCRTTGQNT